MDSMNRPLLKLFVFPIFILTGIWNPVAKASSEKVELNQLLEATFPRSPDYQVQNNEQVWYLDDDMLVYTIRMIDFSALLPADPPDDLTPFFESMIKGAVESTNGALMQKAPLRLGSLNGMAFAFKTANLDGNYTLRSKHTYMQGKVVYDFEVMYLETDAQAIEAQKTAFFETIQLRQPESTSSMGWPILGIVLLIVVIGVILRIKQKSKPS